MKSRRFQQYLRVKGNKKAEPILQKEEVQKNPDKKIDQDFPGYPHGQASEEIIKPKTENQKKTAAVNTRDGEKIITKPSPKRKVAKEQESNGSANAFDDK